MINGRATAEGTASFAAKVRVAEGHFHTGFDGLTMSSLGMGTYLGKPDDATDSAVSQAVAAAFAGGLNVFDSAINYRAQRGERSLGAGLAAVIKVGGDRSQFFVSTKAGYIPGDGSAPQQRESWVRETYLKPGIVAPSDLVGGIQCIAPGYLLDQIQRSRRNLGLATIDQLYIHNPEYIVPVVGRNEWRRRMEAAFRTLEDAAEQGLIAGYGVATWDGFRVEPARADHLELAELVELAAVAAASRNHRFRAIQLPISLACREAFESRTQTIAGRSLTLMEAAGELGVHVFASAPVHQGKAAAMVGDKLILYTPGLTTNMQRALQWTRSLPGLTTALVGMKDPAHVAENLELVRRPPLKWA